MEDFVLDPRHSNGCTLIFLHLTSELFTVIFTIKNFSNETFGARPFCKHVGPNLLPNAPKIPKYESSKTCKISSVRTQELKLDTCANKYSMIDK